MNVGAQRLERRDVDDPDFVGERLLETLAHEIIDGAEKCGERLARSGRRGDERVASVTNRRPAALLRRRRRAERFLEPTSDNWMESCEHWEQPAGRSSYGIERGDAPIQWQQAQIPFDAREREIVTIADGATWLKHCLSLGEQRALVDECRAIMDGPAGGYVPTVRGGGKMHVRMTCLGRHWNALTYKLRVDARRS